MIPARCSGTPIAGLTSAASSSKGGSARAGSKGSSAGTGGRRGAELQRGISGRTIRTSVARPLSPTVSAAVAAAASASTCAEAVAAAGAAAAALVRGDEAGAFDACSVNSPSAIRRSQSVPGTPPMRKAPPASQRKGAAVQRAGGPMSSPSGSSRGSVGTSSSCLGSSIRGGSACFGPPRRLSLRPATTADDSFSSTSSFMFTAPAFKGRSNSVVLAGLRVFLLERFGTLREAFDRMDFHRDGRISCLEWQEVLSGQEKYCGLHEAREMFCYLARGTDGWLTWKEFNGRLGNDRRWRSSVGDGNRTGAGDVGAIATPTFAMVKEGEPEAHSPKRGGADWESAASTRSRCSSPDRSALASHPLGTFMQGQTPAKSLADAVEHEEEAATTVHSLTSRSSQSALGAWSSLGRGGAGRAHAATMALRHAVTGNTGGTSIASASTSAVSGAGASANANVQNCSHPFAVGSTADIGAKCAALGEEGSGGAAASSFTWGASSPGSQASAAISSVPVSPRAADDSALCGEELAQKAQALLVAASESKHRTQSFAVGSTAAYVAPAGGVFETRTAHAEQGTVDRSSPSRTAKVKDGGDALAQQFLEFLGGGFGTTGGGICQSGGSSSSSCVGPRPAIANVTSGPGRLAVADGVSRRLEEGLHAFRAEVAALNELWKSDGCSSGLASAAPNVMPLAADTAFTKAAGLTPCAALGRMPATQEPAVYLRQAASPPMMCGLPWVPLLPAREQGRLAACRTPMEALNVLDEVLDSSSSASELSSIPAVGSSGEFSSAASCLRKGRWRYRSRGGDAIDAGVSRSCSPRASSCNSSRHALLKANGAAAHREVSALSAGTIRGAKEADILAASAELLRSESARAEALEEELRTRQRLHEEKVAELRQRHRQEQKKAVRRLFNRLAPPQHMLPGGGHVHETQCPSVPGGI